MKINRNKFIKGLKKMIHKDMQNISHISIIRTPKKIKIMEENQSFKVEFKKKFFK